jgi:hypothetical protein
VYPLLILKDMLARYASRAAGSYSWTFGGYWIAFVVGLAFTTASLAVVTQYSSNHLKHRPPAWPGLVADVIFITSYVVTDEYLRDRYGTPFLRTTKPVQFLLANAWENNDAQEDDSSVHQVMDRIFGGPRIGTPAVASSHTKKPLIMAIIPLFSLGAFSGVADGKTVPQWAESHTYRALANAIEGGKNSTSPPTTTTPTSTTTTTAPSANVGGGLPTPAPTTTTTLSSPTPNAYCESDIYAILRKHLPQEAALTVTSLLDNFDVQITGCPGPTPLDIGNFVLIPLRQGASDVAPFAVLLNPDGAATLVDPAAISALSIQATNLNLVAVRGMWANAPTTDPTNRRSFLYELEYENGSDALLIRTVPQTTFLWVPTSVTDLATTLAAGRGYLQISQTSDTGYQVNVLSLVTNEIVESEQVTFDVSNGAASASGMSPAYLDSTSPNMSRFLMSYPNGSDYMLAPQQHT